MRWRDLASHQECESWKPGVMNILKYYHERLEDSWIEERHFGVIFHYDRAIKTDIGYEGATRQAGECATQINDSCRSSHVRAVPIDNMVVIELMDHNKMTAASWVLEYESNRLGGVPELPDLADRRESLADSAVDRTSPKETKRGSPDAIEPLRISINTPTGADTPTLHSARSGSPQSNYFPEEPIISPKVIAEPDPRAVMPDFMMVCGDSRDDERLFRWTNEKSDENAIKNVISLYVGSKPTTEATTTLKQGVIGKCQYMLSMVKRTTLTMLCRSVDSPIEACDDLMPPGRRAGTLKEESRVTQAHRGSGSVIGLANHDVCGMALSVVVECP